MDAYRHVNNAAYLTYLEEVRDEWLELVFGESAAIWDYVLARVAIDFRSELRQEDDAVFASCRLDRIGTSSVTHERGDPQAGRNALGRGLGGPRRAGRRGGRLPPVERG